MNYNEVIKLVSVQKSVDTLGDLTETRTEKQVFCKIKSVNQSEFYQAQASGLKPEIKFAIADYYDYSDEPEVEYTTRTGTVVKYKVIRTYRAENSTELELICSKGL